MSSIQKTIFFIVFILLSIYVLTFTPNIPIADQWSFIHIIKQPNIQNLWARVSEHRVFFPNLITVFLAHISQWNLKYETFASLLLFSMLMLLIYNSFSKNISNKSARILFFFALLAQYSPIHHENILFSFSAYLLCLVFVFLAIINSYNTGSNLRSLLIMIISLVIASFSFLTGLLGWIACLPGIIFSPKKNIQNMLIFFSAGILTYMLYFSENVLTKNNTALPLTNTIKIIEYFFVYFGANFIPTYKVGHLLPILLLIAGIWGFIFFVIGAVLVFKTYKYGHKETIIPYSMMFYSILTAFITSIGRVNFGIKFALLSRYHMFQMFYFLGFIWLFLLYLIRTKKIDHYLKPAILIFTLVIISNWASGIALGIYKIKKFAPIEKELRLKGDRMSIKSSEQIYGDRKVLEEGIKTLKELKYNVFGD